MSSSLEGYLSLDTSHPTLLNILGAHYLHSDLIHLLSNLILYLFFMIVIFVCDAFTNQKMLFINLLLLFILLPIFSSFIDILAFSAMGIDTVAKGFSDIVAGVFGYLAFSFLHFLRDHYKTNFKHDILPLLWFFLLVNLLWICIIYVNYFLILLLVLILIVWSYSIRFDIRKIYEITGSSNRVEKAATFGVLTFYLFVGIFYFFPSEILYNNSIVDILAHYVGYVYGAMVPALVSTYGVERRMKKY